MGPAAGLKHRMGVNCKTLSCGACWGTFIFSIAGACVGGLIEQWHGAVLGLSVGFVLGMFIGFSVAAFIGIRANRTTASASVAPMALDSTDQPPSSGFQTVSPFSKVPPVGLPPIQSKDIIKDVNNPFKKPP